MTKRTFGGTSRKRKRVSGFRVRMRSHTGRRVIKSRRKRGRERRGGGRGSGRGRLKPRAQLALKPAGAEPSPRERD